MSTQTGIETYLGAGDGTFTQSSSFVNANTTVGLATADLNNDGAVDIIAGSEIAVLGLFYADTQSVTTMEQVNLNTRQGALNAMSVIDAALTRVAKELGGIGSSQSRLSTATANLLQTVESFRDAASRIEDVDVATESAQLTRTQILQQAGSAVLGQANLLPSLVLSLLQS